MYYERENREEMSEEKRPGTVHEGWLSLLGKATTTRQQQQQQPMFHFLF
jgi:hypothetical protein